MSRFSISGELTMSPEQGGDARVPVLADGESTVDLIQRAREGDRHAIEKLFTRHLGPLKRWARGRLPTWARDVTDTDDLVQNALAQTFKRLNEFEPRHAGALQAYLRQAVLNSIRNELRRKARRPHVTGIGEVDVESPESPLEQAIGREALERYERALQRLTVDDRETVVARVEMGFSYDEIAETLGKPTAEAARKAARRALTRLAREMERESGRPAG